jgi:hypothetical protein
MNGFYGQNFDGCSPAERGKAAYVSELDPSVKTGSREKQALNKIVHCKRPDVPDRPCPVYVQNQWAINKSMLPPPKTKEVGPK